MDRGDELSVVQEILEQKRKALESYNRNIAHHKEDIKALQDLISSEQEGFAYWIAKRDRLMYERNKRAEVLAAQDKQKQASLAQGTSGEEPDTNQYLNFIEFEGTGLQKFAATK